MIDIGYERRMFSIEPYSDDPRCHLMDGILGARFFIGNIFGRVQPLLILRVGRVGPVFEKERIPSVAEYSAAERELFLWDLYLFLRVSPFVSFWNFSIDGRMFADDEITQELRSYTSDGDVGLHVGVAGFSFDFSLVARSPEYMGQEFSLFRHVFWQTSIGYEW